MKPTFILANRMEAFLANPYGSFLILLKNHINYELSVVDYYFTVAPTVETVGKFW